VKIHMRDVLGKTLRLVNRDGHLVTGIEWTVIGVQNSGSWCGLRLMSPSGHVSVDAWATVRRRIEHGMIAVSTEEVLGV
jgi:hypothetical protein